MVISKQIGELEEQLLIVKDTVEKIDVLNALAKELIERDSARSQNLAELALNLSRLPEPASHLHPLGSALALITLGELAIKSNSYGLALTYQQEAYALLQDFYAPKLLAEVSHGIGWSHYRLGNFTEAVVFLGKSLKIFHDLENREKESSVLSSLGSLYNTQGDHARALEIFNQARVLLEDQGDTRTRAVTLNNLALTQMKMGAFEAALVNAQASYAIVKKLELPSPEVDVLDTIGEIYLASGDIRNAEKTYLTCLDLARRIDLEHTQLQTMLSLGKVYMKQGLLDKAHDHFTRAVSLAESQRNEKYRSLYHEMLTQICEMQKDYQEALFHYKEYHAAMQNFLDESTRFRLENLKILHQEEKTRKEAEMLWLQNQSLEQEIEDRLREHAELEMLATTDSLTGLYSRRHFFTLGEFELEKSRQIGSPLTLIFLDIDHFKLVNDQYGHATGDLVLARIARLLSDNARKGDIICRIGGEEFVILLPDTQLATGQAAAERIRLTVFTNPIQIDQAMIRITASLGVVEARANDHDLAAVLARSDEALFRAKSAGRNQVSI